MPDSPIVQSKSGTFDTSDPSLAFASDITEGNLLLLVLSGMGYAAAAAVLSAAIDTLNEAEWEAVPLTAGGSLNTEDQNDGSDHHYSLAAFYFRASAAGACTVDLTATAGQSPAFLAIYELAVDDVDVAALLNPATADGSGDITGPDTAATLADDWVMGFGGGYSSEATDITLVSEGWTFDQHSTANDAASLGSAWLDDQTGSGDTPGGCVMAGWYAGGAATAAATIAFKASGGSTTTDFDAAVDATSDVTVSAETKASAGAGVEATSGATAGFTSTVRMGVSVEARSGATAKFTGGGRSTSNPPPAAGRGPVRRLGVGPS